VLENETSVTLAQAVRALHSVAVDGKKTQSPGRLDLLARYCVEQLARRGLHGACTEVTIPGGARPKKWDVAWQLHGKPRLAISLKSILQNLAGTVPNRIDDLMGEVANVQMFSPEIVVGYLIVFDVSLDAHSPKHGTTWCELLDKRLARLTGRSGPAWGFGMIEGVALVRVDFSAGALLISSEEEVEALFDRLVSEVAVRNPSMQDGYRT